MSKILFIGDPHLKMNRFDMAKSFLEWINFQIAEHKPDIVINLGDTFDNHAVIRSEIQGEFRKHIDFVMSLNIKYYYILGNHDQYRPKDNKYHALQSFVGINDNFIVVDKRIDIDNITMVPFIADIENFPIDTREICIAHQTFIGADYGYHRPDAGVNADDIKANIIISGHVHKKQEFGKVVYPGTPYSHNINDIDMIKGITIFDTATYERSFVESPFPRWKSIKFEVSEDQPMDDFHDILSNTLNTSDHWILQVVGPRVEITAYFNSAKYKKIIKDKHVTPKITATDKEKKQVQIKAISEKEIVKEFIDKVYKGGGDKSKLLIKAYEIMDKYKKV